MAIASWDLPIKGNGLTAELVWAYIKVPMRGALRYGPSAALAVAAAFCSAQWAQHNTIFPPVLAWTIGAAKCEPFRVGVSAAVLAFERRTIVCGW